ncbi:3-hydroxybutyryl-CoA dehydrogenase [Actinomadura sp. NBRC 104412]|uniref:3-hydroxyacyl-CoA dehydrogenase family protein n=1 Tax=Actinomadura sp. NBRC 104412 TaxID=3032203 RepID=UPI0024A2D1B9|nr:3-hydroxyacyl-CoA dehydrogenase family protein [Actinomadura sp. NBRC 104412]GLZ07508.1 3-hydroxybutyryl-CoA dehydrogenase [Actinomadura sp. NBRC 104412]
MADDGRPVGVVGFGAMGSGIATVCAAAGHTVVAVDTTWAALDAGLRRQRDFLAGSVERGKITEAERDATLGRITRGTELAALADARLVIEAVVERADVKHELVGRLGTVLAHDAVLATNTSALSVTGLARHAPDPERVAGLHFFNPPQLMPLVEVVRALQTGDSTVQTLVEFAESLGKRPVVVPDRPGFLVNRLLMPYLNDVVQAYDDGLASAADLDTAIRLGLGHPMGPLELLDLIGVDVHLHATTAAYDATRDPRFAPPPLLTRMVEADRLGAKSGRGFREGAGE